MTNATIKTYFNNEPNNEGTQFLLSHPLDKKQLKTIMKGKLADVNNEEDNVFLNVDKEHMLVVESLLTSWDYHETVKSKVKNADKSRKDTIISLQNERDDLQSQLDKAEEELKDMIQSKYDKIINNVQNMIFGRYLGMSCPLATMADYWESFRGEIAENFDGYEDMIKEDTLTEQYMMTEFFWYIAEKLNPVEDYGAWWKSDNKRPFHPYLNNNE